MNCVFSIIWSQARRALVVASELANRRGNGGGDVDKRKALCKLMLHCVAVEGLPPAWPLRLGLLLTLLALNPPARAVDYHWDVDGAAAGAGGATPGGTWSAGGTTLSTDANGAAATTAVTTTTADRLIFSAGTNATGAYTVTASGTQNIGRLTFQEGAVNLTGGTINFGSASGLIEGDATPDTISSVITGTNGVRFSGGTVTLAGTNTFTGSAVLGGALTQGTVILAAPGGNAISGSFLQMGSGNQSTRGGTVTLGAAEQINDTATLTMGSGHFSGNSLFSLNGFNETLGGINLTHFGEGSGVTVRNGAATDATLTLTGSGTYTTASGDRSFGRSIQNGGAGRLHIVVALTGAGMQTFSGTAPSYTGNTTVNSGTLQLWNTALWASNAILNGGTLRLHQTSTGTGNLAGAATRTHANTIGGTGGTLRKTGDGTIILSGANTYQGATAIDAGTLRAGSATAFGISSAVTLANVAGATMDLNNFNITIGSLAGGGTTGGNVTLGSGTLTTGGDDTSTVYGGVIGGTGALVKTGAGTQTLTGASTYTADTTIASGTLQLGDGGATGSIVGDVVNDGVLAFKRSDTFTFGGVVSGRGSLSQVGSGTTALTSANSYTGGTAINAGVLQISSDANLGNAAGGLGFDGGTLQNTAAFSAARAVALNAGGGTFQTDANLALSGAISGTGELRKTGGEALVLTAANTYTGGTTISAGTLQLGNGGTSGSIVGNVVNNGTLAFNRSDTLSFGGVISGSGAVNQIGAGTTILTAGNTYTGTTTISAGTLQLGNGGTSGSIVGNVGNNGTLAFNRSDTLSLGGTISGGGAVSQIGAGTTVLAGVSTYTGGTTIASGTLQLGNGGTSGSIVGNVVNNGTLAFNRSDTLSFGGVISGSGAVNQIGAGTTILTAGNTYTGTTTISAGTLQLGNGGTSGSIVGNVGNNGTLAFNRSDTLSLGGTISGGGAVSQIGAGTTVLAGVSTYTGGTTIASGTLQLGNGGTSGSIVGNVVNNGTLAFNRSDMPSFGGVITGPGAIRQIGSGMTNLTGNSAAFTGTTSVEAGTLAVNGRLCGTLNVLSGGRLQGTGRVCDTTNFTGGTVAPGNSIGTLSVNGNFAQLTGSTYEVEVDPASTAADLIHVSGSARIGAGARLEVVRVGATNYHVGTRYTVLTADGGVTGTYSLAGDTQSAFARLTDSYDANHVYLTPEKFRNITDAAGTPNEAAVGAALDSLPGSNGLANAVAWLPNDFAARDALNQLSADIHASTKTALLEDSRFVREAAIDRLRGAACAPGSATASPSQTPQQMRAGCTPEDRQKHSAWAHAFDSWGSIDGDDNAAKLKRDIGGFMVGADTGVGAGWRVGALGGYSRASADTGARNSSSKTDSYLLGAYGGTQWGATALRLGASHSWNKTKTNRSIAFAGFAGALDAEYDSTTTQVFGELGHQIELGRAILEPFAGLAHVRLKSDAFLERGGPAAMYGERDSDNATFSTIGLRASTQVSEGTRLRGMLGWRHAFGDTRPTSTHTFSGSLPFTLAGVPLAKNGALIEAGIETQLRPNLTLGASYSGQFGDGLQDHGFKASLNWKF